MDIFPVLTTLPEMTDDYFRRVLERQQTQPDVAKLIWYEPAHDHPGTWTVEVDGRLHRANREQARLLATIAEDAGMYDGPPLRRGV